MNIRKIIPGEKTETMVSRIFGAVCVVMILALSGVGSPARADIIEYNGVATIALSDFPTDIAVGDIFYVSLTYDDSDTDTNPSTYAGTFNDALQTLVITPDPGNTGTWDPSIGTWNINPSDNHHTNANGDNMGIQNHGSGFAPLGGLPFHDGTPSWDWDAFIHDLVDTGSGQTLRELFGDVSPEFAFTSYSLLELRNTDYESAMGEMVFVSTAPTATPPPEPVPATSPAGLGLLLLAAGGLLTLSIRR